MSFFDYLAHTDKRLDRDLKIADLRETPEEFLRKNFRLALIFALGIGFAISAQSISNAIISLPISFMLMILLFRGRVRQAIKKREREIERDLLFAGQYMLVKLQSGLPLFNTLIDASRENNATGSFFRQVVQDINTGTPIERALSYHRDLCPSENLKLILSEIVTSLKTGADVSNVLRNSITEITTGLLIEVQTYSKKLNSIMMFYMILGTVLPSIGISLLLILLSFVGVEFNTSLLITVALGLIIMQSMFAAIVHSSRPAVNL